MLFCQLIWVFASFLPYDSSRTCEYSQHDIGLSWVRILITAVLSPLENWVLHEFPLFLSLAPLLHTVCTPIVYVINIYKLRKYRADTAIKFEMCSSSLFFSTQGMFYDTFMYSGSYEHFKRFQSVVFTEQFRDAYLISFFVFGHFFYYFAISFSSEKNKSVFIVLLTKQAFIHGVFIGIIYLLVSDFGIIPEQNGFWRAGYFIILHYIAIAVFLLNFCYFYKHRILDLDNDNDTNTDTDLDNDNDINTDTDLDNDNDNDTNTDLDNDNDARETGNFLNRRSIYRCEIKQEYTVLEMDTYTSYTDDVTDDESS